MIQDQRQFSHVCFHFLFTLATAKLTTSLTHTHSRQTYSSVLAVFFVFFLSETCASPGIVASLPFIFLRRADSTEESTRGTGGGTVCCPLRVN